MKIPKKSLAVILAGMLTMSLVAGCTSKTDSPKEATTPSPYYVVDGKETVVPYVMKIDDQIISIEEYRSYYLSAKMQFESMVGPEVWSTNPELETMLKENAEQQISQSYAIKKMAKDNEIVLGEEDKKELEKIIADVITDFGGEEEYKKALTENFLTEELYRKSIEIDLMASKIYDKFFGENGTKKLTDEQILEDVNKNYAHVKHVLIPLDKEGEETNKKLADEVLAKSKAGEDFDALVKEYGTDPGMEQSPDGYYFTFGEMVKPFEDASFALEVDQVSEIVPSDFGYHIIKKYSIDPEYIKTNSAQFTEAAYNAIIEEILAESVKSLKIEKWEKYDTLNATTVK